MTPLERCQLQSLVILAGSSGSHLLDAFDAAVEGIRLGGSGEDLREVFDAQLGRCRTFLSWPKDAPYAEQKTVLSLPTVLHAIVLGPRCPSAEDLQSLRLWWDSGTFQMDDDAAATPVRYCEALPTRSKRAFVDALFGVCGTMGGFADDGFAQESNLVPSANVDQAKVKKVFCGPKGIFRQMQTRIQEQHAMMHRKR